MRTTALVPLALGCLDTVDTRGLPVPQDALAARDEDVPVFDTTLNVFVDWSGLTADPNGRPIDPLAFETLWQPTSATPVEGDTDESVLMPHADQENAMSWTGNANPTVEILLRNGGSEGRIEVPRRAAHVVPLEDLTPIEVPAGTVDLDLTGIADLQEASILRWDGMALADAAALWSVYGANEEFSLFPTAEPLPAFAGDATWTLEVTFDSGERRLGWLVPE
jgi:hypothetical protein